MAFTETDRQRFKQELGGLRTVMRELCVLLKQLHAYPEPREPAGLKDRIRETAQDLRLQWDVLRQARTVLRPEPEELWRQCGDLLEGPVFFAREAFGTEVERLLEAAERAL